MSRTFRFDKSKPRRLRDDPRCKAKRRYSDQAGARAAAMVAIHEIKNRDRLWVYKCTHCFGWHLTHKNEGSRMLVTSDNPMAGSRDPA